jgi:hypothetical protein
VCGDADLPGEANGAHRTGLVHPLQDVPPVSGAEVVRVVGLDHPPVLDACVDEVGHGSGFGGGG